MEQNESTSNIEKYNAAIELFNANPTTGQAQNFLVQNGLISAETVDMEWSIILVRIVGRINV